MENEGGRPGGPDPWSVTVARTPDSVTMEAGSAASGCTRETTALVAVAWGTLGKTTVATLTTSFPAGASARTGTWKPTVPPFPAGTSPTSQTMVRMEGT